VQHELLYFRKYSVVCNHVSNTLVSMQVHTPGSSRTASTPPLLLVGSLDTGSQSSPMSSRRGPTTSRTASGSAPPQHSRASGAPSSGASIHVSSRVTTGASLPSTRVWAQRCRRGGLTASSAASGSDVYTRAAASSTLSSLGPTPPPPPEDDTEEKQLDRALDHLYDTHEAFHGGYEVLSFMARRQGGQGVVQFMRRASDGLDFAVKFFNDRRGAHT
jgi:hypothetical protein